MASKESQNQKQSWEGVVRAGRKVELQLQQKEDTVFGRMNEGD